MAGVQSLMIPTGVATLVVPSATVAEVIAGSPGLKPLPGVEPWVLGYFRWRNYPVTLVSFERLAAGRDISSFYRLCVFFPLPGREAFDYFALGLTGEPRGLEITDSAGPGALPAGLSQRFAAGAITMDDRTLVIPDFDALKAAFYPDR
jgi:chemotaxis signal transduction protein